LQHFRCAVAVMHCCFHAECDAQRRIKLLGWYRNSRRLSERTLRILIPQKTAIPDSEPKRQSQTSAGHAKPQLTLDG
jgi:hypothetical protein